ncbi:unnamed protein product [Gongylonema pulchrum]|uniref:F-box domain-containing protein n=1 Tax=Gongylonema pulchrum TaxID=637853 RepID=A0A3P6RFQ5_9BILA|nr:unnamed protein product [Gongylonema pulchrum]
MFQDDDDTYFLINTFPEEILLHIFLYLHPRDLIHSASLVCRRWNRIANDYTLHREARIKISEETLKSGCVKRFLQRLQ